MAESGLTDKEIGTMTGAGHGTDYQTQEAAHDQAGAGAGEGRQAQVSDMTTQTALGVEGDGVSQGGTDGADSHLRAREMTADDGLQEAQASFTRQLAERDKEIASLKAQIADASKSAETASALQAKIAELEESSRIERTDFELTLAGCRSTRAARALLDDYEGDIDALRKGEPWLFVEKEEPARGTTGLANAGAASGDEAALAHWRRVAGLDD